jgi:hypothetical protein
MSLPDRIDQRGWPEFLTDAEDETYVLLRDASWVPGAVGNPCVYGLIDSEGYICRDRQFQPALGATEEEMRMAPGPWVSAETMIEQDVPPITIPDEPVDVPDEGDSRRHILPRRRQDG